MASQSRTDTAAPPGPRRHDIGPGGLVSIATDFSDVRVRGVAGTEARVIAPADGAGIETLAEPGHFSVRTSRSVGIDRAAFVGIQVGSRGFGVPLRLRVSGTVEVEVPRDARVVVTSAAGDIAVRDVLGAAALKTASGDVSVDGAAGAVSAETASGSVGVSAGAPVALDVRAVSGRVRARAPMFERVAVETISGDVELAGEFAREVEHAVSTVSGSVDLALAGGLTLAVRTVSGSVDCSHPERHGGDGRALPLVIGDGAARLAVQTMSGRVGIRASRRASTSAATEPAAAETEVTRVAPAAAAPAAAGPDPADRPDGGTMAILEALARGEIDVADAERRLAEGSIDA